MVVVTAALRHYGQLACSSSDRTVAVARNKCQRSCDTRQRVSTVLTSPIFDHCPADRTKEEEDGSCGLKREEPVETAG